MDLTAGSLGDSAKTKSIFSISVTMSYRIKKKMKTNTFIFLLNFGIQIMSLVVIFFLFLFVWGGVGTLATLYGMWDLSSPTRNPTCAPCSGSMKS